ncbi:uncharacterized protein PV06_00752 [Exophiala oligosperma]|uniref:Uncharacterized protein n=2 Tax=Chaetothyriales TaxID=34395 RepID=A0A0D2DYG5_9EURO|nr:uncharacterized protein PV06_00752 [Exophiala oligosperma]KAJ9618599.1 hypothetical protein H2204_012952 [Knufia peltigerae]KIW48133.1 hypothetical protein PV06_00752 [Exophiala oligosperma]
MGNRGRLGLLFDAETDLEIDALSGAWLLPPAASDTPEDEDERRVQAVDIVIQYVEWADRRSTKAPETAFHVHIMLQGGHDASRKTK